MPGNLLQMGRNVRLVIIHLEAAWHKPGPIITSHITNLFTFPSRRLS